MPRARLGRPVGRRFLYEWAGVGCVGIAIVLLSVLLHWTAGADHLVYDRFLRARSYPVSPDVVVIEIDDASMAALGRWPWPRSVHARLQRQLARAGVAASVYDVLFTEPSRDDDALAQAIAANRTYLPILLTPANAAGQRDAVLPVAPLAHAAAGLGHINIEVDSDGTVRSVALFEGDAHQRWPQLMSLVWRAVAAGDIALPGGIPKTMHGDELAKRGGPGSEARFLIPFSASAQQHRSVSFAKVLDGSVPPDLLRGRIALVGVTASGLYDRFSTPLSGTLGQLPGVYLHANILDTLLNGTAIVPAATPWVVFASLVPLLLMLAGFLVLSPWRALVVSALLGVAAFVASAALLYGAGVWLSPVPAVAALLVVYPMWSWRRLETTMSHLRRALIELADEPYLLPEAPAPRREYAGDALAQQMALMAKAAQRLQDMRRFVWDSLDSVPEPILVADLRGVVLIANHAARASFRRLGIGTAEGRTMPDVFRRFKFVKPIDPDTDAHAYGQANAHWPALLDPTRADFAALIERGIEVRATDGSAFLLRYARCTNAQGQAVGWIAGLVDVTALHYAERQREDALRLLSHDMRSPQASIVALVETERGAIHDGPTRDVMDRIERYARRSLKLADDFVQLARAESQVYALEPASFDDLVIDASDEVWPQARAKRIQIDTDFQCGDMGWINADRSLMTRALVNILNNAVKYSPADTRIVCTTRVETSSSPSPSPSPPSPSSSSPRVVCAIRDEGYGIAREDQANLFAPFRRFHTAQLPEVGGAGLGMVFVKTVVTRHGGEIRVESEPGHGTTFTMTLPALDAPL